MKTVSDTVARKHRAVRVRGVLQQVFCVMELAQLAGDHDQNGGEHGHRYRARQRGGQQDDQQHDHGVREAGHAGARGRRGCWFRCARSRGGRHAAEQRRQDVGCALATSSRLELWRSPDMLSATTADSRASTPTSTAMVKRRANQFQHVRKADLGQAGRRQ